MIKRRGPPSQTWRTFLDNHGKDIIVLDFFAVPTATFRILFVLIILGERHLKRILSSYVDYYNDARTHLSLAKDAPVGRVVKSAEKGRVVELEQVSGLHHLYTRMAA